MLAHARSCSVSSIAPPTQNQTQYNTTNENARQFTENSRHNAEVANARQYEGQRQSYNSEQRQSYNNDGRLSRASSSSSSGCLSDGAPSSCEVNATDDPWILQTSRFSYPNYSFDVSYLFVLSSQVAFECGEFPTGTIKRKPSMNPKLPLTSITRQLKEVGETVRDEPDSCPSPTSSGSGTLTRRHSRRRSGTDSDGSGTLKRHHRSGNATPVSPVPPGTPVRERASPMGYNRSDNQESKTPTSPIPSCMVSTLRVKMARIPDRYLYIHFSRWTRSPRYHRHRHRPGSRRRQNPITSRSPHLRQRCSDRISRWTLCHLPRRLANCRCATRRSSPAPR